MKELKNLSDFNKDTLTDIIRNLSEAKRIFNSEAQFQFELGWKIYEEFDCEVKFEELSRIIPKDGKTRSKKDYTDLILEKGNLRIAIELKDKTATYEDEGNNILLKNHGAVDLGRYDYMWDIHRVQVLTGREKEGEVRMPCNKGYAVILTKEKSYWEGKDPTGIDREFLIGENIKITRNEHQWWSLNENGNAKRATKDDLSSYPTTVNKNTSRTRPIEITEDHKCEWIDYCSLKKMVRKKEIEVPFKFMVVDVKCSDEWEIFIIKDIMKKRIAKQIKEKYGFRWVKCVDLAISASWYNREYTKEELESLDEDELFKEVCNEIDNNVIM